MKRIKSTSMGQPETVGPLDIMRALPSPKTNAVGPVILLDHILEQEFAPGSVPAPDGSFAHPHRGIATFSYLLKGEIEHFDSNGGHGVVHAGGVQWMNAGNGIIHDEGMTAEFRKAGGSFYAFQFWVNLPAKNKAEEPGYMPLEAGQLPAVACEGGAIKVLLGSFDGQSSPIPAFSEQFIWHLRVDAGAAVELPTTIGHELAGYLPAGGALISGTQVQARQFFAFEDEGEGIRIENQTDDSIDVMVFGGEPYREPTVSHGPFVMNSTLEIQQAYDDFRSGKYGRIDYNRSAA